MTEEEKDAYEKERAELSRIVKQTTGKDLDQ